MPQAARGRMAEADVSANAVSKTFPGEAMARALSRVVEDDPDGVPHAGSNAAHAVAEIHAIAALRPHYWAVVDCEGHSISLTKRHDFGP